MQMQPSDHDELSERELDALLPEWKVPMAPARLRVAVFPEGRLSWWKRLWTGSVRVPLPVICVVLFLLAVLVWRNFNQRTIYRDRVMPSLATTGSESGELQPVTELRPRIIRGGNVQN
jgi:hypothetical protein